MRRGLLLLVLVALAAGCGGGDETDETAQTDAAATDTAPTVPKTQWAEQADEICAEYQGRIDAVGAPETPEQLGPVLAETAEIAKEQVDELRALEPEEDQRELVERFLGKLDEATASLEEFAEATEANDETAATQALEESTAVNAEAVELARQLGLTVCGQT